MSPTERQRLRRERLKKQGFKRIEIEVSQALAGRLESQIKDYGGLTGGTLQKWLERLV